MVLLGLFNCVLDVLNALFLKTIPYSFYSSIYFWMSIIKRPLNDQIRSAIFVFWLSESLLLIV